MAVNLSLTDPLSTTKLTAVRLPLMKRDPVNLCRSSILSPNFVLPLVNIIDELTISV